MKYLAFAAGALAAMAAHAEITDLNGADLTVTSLTGDEVFVNSSSTEATLTFDLADDATWTGSVSNSVRLVKTGAGTLTVDGIGYAGAGGVDITGGILKLGDNCSSRALGATDTVVTINGGTLDINFPISLTTDSQCRPRDIITHDVIIHVAGTGHNGYGAITNSVNSSWRNKAFGRIVLDGDASLASSGRMDLETATSSGFGYTSTATFTGSHTVTFLAMDAASREAGAEFGGMSTSTWSPDKIVLAADSILGFEGSPTVNVPNGVEMHGGMLAFSDAAPLGSTFVKAVEGDNSLRIGRGSCATFTTPVTVDSGATLHLTQMSGSSANYTTKIWTFASVVTNNGTFSVDTSWHTISSPAFYNNGTLLLGTGYCLFSNMVFMTTGTINGGVNRMQFYGTLVSTNENLALTTAGGGIDFHPTTVTLAGKTLALSTVGKSVWFGGGQGQLVADGPVAISPGGSADIRAYATDYPVAPSITLDVDDGNSVVFNASGRYSVTPTNDVRTAYLNGASYVLPGNAYWGVISYNLDETGQDVRTVLTNATWSLVNSVNGLGLGNGGNTGWMALGTNASVATRLVKFRTNGGEVARFAQEDGSVLTFDPGDSSDSVGFYIDNPNQSTNCYDLSGGTLTANSDWGVWYYRRDGSKVVAPYWGFNMTLGAHGGAATIDLNGQGAEYNSGLRGLADVTIKGEGDFATSRRVQGVLRGSVSVSGAGHKNLSGTTAFPKGLTIGTDVAATVGIASTGTVKMALIDCSMIASDRRGAGCYTNLAEAMSYSGDFPYRATSLDTVHRTVAIPSADAVIADGAAMVYEGQFYAPQSGTYTFAGTYNNGIELAVDGERVLQSVGFDQAQSGQCELTEGWHDFRVALISMGGDVFGPTLWSSAGMGLGWTFGAVDAASVSNAPNGLVRFDTDTLAMRPHAPAEASATGSTVRWRHAPYSYTSGMTEPEKDRTTSLFDDREWDADTTTNSFQFLNTFYAKANVPSGWLAANAVNDVWGYFLVEDDAAGEWTFRLCFDNAVCFWVDDDTGEWANWMSNANPYAIKTMRLAAGWHRFRIRTLDWGGNVGGSRNSSCAVRAQVPGGSFVAFDERNFTFRATLDELRDEVSAGLSGAVTLASGASLTNTVAAGACPVWGTVTAAGNNAFSGPFKFMPGSSLSCSVSGAWMRSLAAGGFDYANTCEDAWTDGGTFAIDFAEAPKRADIRVGASGGLENLTDEQLAERVTATIAGEEASWLRPVVSGGVLYIANGHAEGTTIIIR